MLWVLTSTSEVGSAAVQAENMSKILSAADNMDKGTRSMSKVIHVLAVGFESLYVAQYPKPSS